MRMPECFIGTSLDEQETTITMSRTEDTISIYTSDNTMLTKLKKLIAEPDTQYTLVDVQYADGNPISVTVEAPVRCLSLRAGSKREISEEQRAALAERMKGLAAARKKQ